MFVVAGGGTGQADQRDIRLDVLFDELKDADSAETAAVVEFSIQQIWMDPKNDTTHFLMAKGIKAISEGDMETALEMFTVITEDDPDFAEGWNKRATLYFKLGDYTNSVSDIQKTLALEPRHFGAMSGMGMIFMETGNEEGALSAYRKALEVHPNLPAAKAMVERLAPLVEGQEI